ncbi:hypothetical protein [Nocardioides sp.]|uniref:hypothetical protein n=1 Tax=Nocardioides sp. TaxID=35761 RepID=UPI003D09DB1E
MKSRLSSTLVAAALVASPLLVIGAGTDAGAETTLHAAAASSAAHHPSVRQVRDSRGDVQKVTDRAGQETFAPAPSRRHGDITSLRVRHAGSAVVATVRMRSLSRHDRLFGAVLQLRTGRATYTAVLFRMAPGEPLSTDFEGGGETACAGLRHHVSYRHDRITIAVPRTCLGSPAWVRARAVIDYFGRPVGGESFFADAAPGSTLVRIPFMAKAWHPGA